MSARVVLRDPGRHCGSGLCNMETGICDSEHPTGKRTAIDLYMVDEIPSDTLYSKTEGGARRMAQRHAKRLHTKVEVE